jgi:hypothetical protein
MAFDKGEKGRKFSRFSKLFFFSSRDHNFSNGLGPQVLLLFLGILLVFIICHHIFSYDQK